MKALLTNALSFFLLVFQLSIEQAQTVAEQVEMKAKVVQSEVKAVTARHKKALEERECELLWKVMAPRPPPGLHAAHVSPRTTRESLDPSSKCREYLVVFQSLLAEEFRGPWNLVGALRAVKHPEAFSEAVGAPRPDGVPRFVLLTRAQEEAERREHNRSRCYESRPVGNILIFGVLAGRAS